MCTSSCFLGRMAGIDDCLTALLLWDAEIQHFKSLLDVSDGVYGKTGILMENLSLVNHALYLLYLGNLILKQTHIHFIAASLYISHTHIYIYIMHKSLEPQLPCHSDRCFWSPPWLQLGLRRCAFQCSPLLAAGAILDPFLSAAGRGICRIHRCNVSRWHGMAPVSCQAAMAHFVWSWGGKQTRGPCTKNVLSCNDMQCWTCILFSKAIGNVQYTRRRRVQNRLHWICKPSECSSFQQRFKIWNHQISGLIFVSVSL